MENEIQRLQSLNHELVAALRAIRDLDDDASADDCADLAGQAITRAESATPAKQSQAIDAESLIAACIPGGSICDPQQVADAIREYLRTPAPHADTVRLNQRSIQLVAYNYLTGEWEPTIFEDVDLRAAIDAAMNGGAND